MYKKVQLWKQNSGILDKQGSETGIFGCRGLPVKPGVDINSFQTLLHSNTRQELFKAQTCGLILRSLMLGTLGTEPSISSVFKNTF